MSSYVLHLFLLLIIGVIGAFIGIRLKIPAGVFLGPIVFVGVYQVIFGNIIEKPSWLRLAIQIAVGLVVGTNFTKSFLIDLKGLAASIAVACFTLLSSAVLLGVLLSCLTGWDLVTSILSTVPGGQAEMAILSDSVGAQTEKVIVLQLVRNQLVLIGMLPTAKILFRSKKKEVA